MEGVEAGGCRAGFHASRNFYTPHASRSCYTVPFPQQLVSQCRSETSCWRIAQCNTGCLTIYLLHEVSHEVELSSTFSFAMDCSN